jgi:LPS O-antigen subunit length determinant protein (WzzB/FepE family)
MPDQNSEKKKETKEEQIKAKYDKRIAELYKAKQEALEAEKAERDRRKAAEFPAKQFKKDRTHLSIIIGTFYIRSMLNEAINATQLLTKIKESIKDGHRDRAFIDRQIEYFKKIAKPAKEKEKAAELKTANT